MSKSNKFSPEARERAVRVVQAQPSISYLAGRGCGWRIVGMGWSVEASKNDSQSITLFGMGWGFAETFPGARKGACSTSEETCSTDLLCACYTPSSAGCQERIVAQVLTDETWAFADVRYAIQPEDR